MRVLLIGGTGRLSAAVARRTIADGHELTAMVRSSGAALPAGTEVIQGDVNDEAGVAERLGDREFDVVVESVAYQTDQVERDLRLFGGRCGQYVFISSASAYQKPVRSLPVGEDTPLDNPYWDYSRAKPPASGSCWTPTPRPASRSPSCAPRTPTTSGPFPSTSAAATGRGRW